MGHNIMARTHKKRKVKQILGQKTFIQNTNVH